MEWERGRVVRSIAGRDRGSFLVVCSAQGCEALVADGRDRPLERLKRKNVKHLRPTNAILPERSMATNREIRRALGAFGADADT